MDLVESLRIFQRLADKKSFSGVAKELGVGQPAVSKAIAALEARLGAHLFRRSSRGLSLTAEGEKLLLVGGPAIDQLEAALACGTSAAKGTRNTCGFVDCCTTSPGWSRFADSRSFAYVRTRPSHGAKIRNQ